MALREDTFTNLPARDLRDGDLMWDASGPYRVSNVRRAVGVVTFDVDSEDFHAEGWQLAADELVRVYV